MLVKMKGLCNTCSQSEVTGAQCAAEARAEWRVTLQLGVCPLPCTVSYSSISVLPFRHRFPFSLLRAATNTNRRRQQGPSPNVNVNNYFLLILILKQHFLTQLFPHCCVQCICCVLVCWLWQQDMLMVGCYYSNSNTQLSNIMLNTSIYIFQ